MAVNIENYENYENEKFSKFERGEFDVAIFFLLCYILSWVIL